MPPSPRSMASLAIRRAGRRPGAGWTRVPRHGPRPANYLFRRWAEDNWPEAAERWGPAYPIATGRTLQDYRDLSAASSWRPTRWPALTYHRDRATGRPGGRAPTGPRPRSPSPISFGWSTAISSMATGGTGWFLTSSSRTAIPAGDGFGGPGGSIRDEINRVRYGNKPMLGMALSGPDTGSSQWFITCAPTASGWDLYRVRQSRRQRRAAGSHYPGRHDPGHPAVGADGGEDRRERRQHPDDRDARSKAASRTLASVARQLGVLWPLLVGSPSRPTPSSLPLARTRSSTVSSTGGLRGPHVDLYYYPAEAALAPAALQYAETSYDTLAWPVRPRRGRPHPPHRVRLAHRFRADQVLPFTPPEGAARRHRLSEAPGGTAVPGNFAEFRHTMRHEMVHVFQLDLRSESYYRAPRSSRFDFPLWWSEGLAELWSGGRGCARLHGPARHDPHRPAASVHAS